MVDKILGVGQSPMAQDPQNPVKKTDKKPITIMAGMTVNDVKQNGSKAQQIAAASFDYQGKDGYDKSEAEMFNSYTFSIDENEKTFMAKKKDGATTCIRYNNLEELRRLLPFLLDHEFKSGYVMYDLRNKKATFEGVISKYGIYPHANLQEVTVRNCDVDYIECGNDFKGKLILENVYASRILGGTKRADVGISKDAVLEVRGNDNKIKVIRYE